MHRLPLHAWRKRVVVAMLLSISCIALGSTGDPETQPPKVAANGFTFPLSSLTLWSDTNYGWCGANYYAGSCHIGSDLGASIGTAVFPVSAGVLVWISGTDDATCSSGWGSTTVDGSTTCNQAIIVEHYDAEGQPFFALYGHLLRDDSRAVGNWVLPDAPLGSVGDWPGFPHLHFGVFVDGFPTTNLGRTPCSSNGTSIPATCDTNGSVAPMNYIGERVSVTPPNPPVLGGPTDGASVDSPVMLTWTNGSGTFRTNVMICAHRDLSGCENPDLRMDGVEPETPFATSFTIDLAPGTYFWAVRGIGFLDFGGWGAYSDVESFEVR